MKKEEEFQPYISPEENPPELTWISVLLGILLAVVFGAANAYLGLRVGMTVSASIPAAVVSMGVVRVLLRRNSVLESNMVQTIGSAGESLAAGAIFTLPALFLWASEGVMEAPGILEITLITLCGGLLGVLFMVPLRKALIVKEHATLPYPEGTACAKVLLAGEEGERKASGVFWGIGIAAILKLFIDGFKILPSVIKTKIDLLKTEISVETYPAILGVGYICGPKIAAYLLAGGVLGWLVIIPMIASFGGNTILFPGQVPIQQIYEEAGANGIWNYYLRYIGAGAVVAGGVISLCKSGPLIISTFKEAIKGIGGGGEKEKLRTGQDFSIRFIGLGILVLLLAIWLLPPIPVSLLGAFMIVLFGFFFAVVSSRMVGMVGSSNNPVSGMTIATLLVATVVLKAAGTIGSGGMHAAIAIGSITCIIVGMAGDTSQDLKTGYLLGATPRSQQIGEIIGCICSAMAIGGVLYLLNAAWGFGSAELSAPQAVLMKMIVEGVLEGNLPWTFIIIGICIAIAIELLGVPVLPVAIGLYLPFSLSSCIMVGAAIRGITDWRKKDSENGVLFSSGLIAGEGLMGILLAILAVFQG